MISRRFRLSLSREILTPWNLLAIPSGALAIFHWDRFSRFLPKPLFLTPKMQL
jgi:hypothetical protein